MAGHYADLPLSATDGPTIADFITDNPTGVRCYRATELANRSYFPARANRVAARRSCSVIDEARLCSSAARAGRTGDDHAIKKLVRQGRTSGFGVMLIDQRSASVNKHVLAMLEVLVAHRTSSPQDRKALDAWVDAHGTPEQDRLFRDTLPTLVMGEAWFWSSSPNLFERVKVRERKTFDKAPRLNLGIRSQRRE